MATAGFDIAKEFHWLAVIDGQGRLLLSRRIDNTPDAITEAIGDLRTLEREYGPVAVGLDVVGGIAGLLTAHLLAEGITCVHVPGLAVNRARRGTRDGENKSDPRDAKVIAEQVLLRDDLRTVELPEESAVEIRLLVSHRTNLVKETTAHINRLRDPLTAIHPGLERTVQPRTKAALSLLSRYVTPTEIRQAGPARISNFLTRRGVRGHRVVRDLPTAQALAEAAVTAARAQHMTMIGERRTAELVKEFAADLLIQRNRLQVLEDEISELVDVHPDGALIRSLPGMGAALTAEFLAAIGSFHRFTSGDALDAASGLAPVLTQSGKVRYSRGATGGDKALKRVFYQSAFCSIKHDPASRTYYDRKRAEGKRHHQALIALARRRVNVLYAILRDRQPYQARPPLRLIA